MAYRGDPRNIRIQVSGFYLIMFQADSLGQDELYTEVTLRWHLNPGT